MWAVRCRASDSPHFPSPPSPPQISRASSFRGAHSPKNPPSENFLQIGIPVIFSYQPRQGEDITAYTNVLHYSHER